MFPVSSDYIEKSQSSLVDYKINIKVYHSTGVLELDDSDLMEGTLEFNESTQASDDFTVGGVVASDVSFEIIKKEEFESINFIGAKVHVITSLKIVDGIDAHFLQASQPSKMKGFDDKWENVPLGIFNIDIADRKRNSILIKAIDNMIYLDKPYTLSKLSYPATLSQIYLNICSVADVSTSTISFPNSNYVVPTRPTGDLNLRDVLSYVAELAGSFARCDRTGQMELSWYKPTPLEITSHNRSDFKVSDFTVQVTGVAFTDVEETTHIIGTDVYAIDLTGNPLLQDKYDVVLPRIFDNIKNTSFIPYTSMWQGCPAIQAGDIVKQIDVDGNEYTSIITNNKYKYRGRTTSMGKGLPNITRGFKSTDKRINQIIRQVEEVVGDRLTDLEQAIIDATDLIVNELGGYVLKKENELLIMDNPDPSEAQKIWRWNLSGLGYSSTGIGGPYGLAMTMNGAINANFVTTGLLSANIVRTGLLQSQDGSTWINLDNDSFNFNNILKWQNNQLTIALQGGVTTINNTGVKVSHTGLGGQYSEMNADGFVRKWQYGESHYLTDIHIVTSLKGSGIIYGPSTLRITIPDRFKGRSNIKAIPILREYDSNVIDRSPNLTLQKLAIILEVISINTTSLTIEPYVMVMAYSYAEFKWNSNGTIETRYQNLSFDLMVIGE